MGKLYVCVNAYQEEFLLPDCLRSIRECMPEAEIILIDGAYESWVTQVKIQAAVEFSEGHPGIAEDMLRLTSPISTDATIQIAKDFKVEHIVMPPTQCMCGGKKLNSGYYAKGAYLPWESEAVKRNRFFGFGRDGDYYFIIDADERMRGKPTEMTENHYAVVLKRDDDIAPYGVHRIYKHRPGINMHGAHMAVWANELVTDPETGVQTVKPVLMKKENEKGELTAPIFGGWTLGEKQKLIPPPGGGFRLDHMYNLRGSRDVIRSQAKGAYYVNGLSKEEKVFRKEHNI